MLIDLLFGLLFAGIGKVYGLSVWQCGVIFVSALALDGDIILNEFWRWKSGQKPKFLTLDEYSYQHKFLLHLPLVIIPAILIFGFFCNWWTFSVLVIGAVLAHLIHDTVDKNFDGVRWAWPFNSFSYKIKIKWTGIILEVKTAADLKKEATEKAKTSRHTKKILKDNII